MTSFINFMCRQTLWIALAAFFFTPDQAPGQSPASLSAALGQTWSSAPAGRQAQDVAPASEGFDTRLFRRVNDAQTPFKTSLFNVTDKSVAVMAVGVPLGCIVYGLAADDRSALNTGVLLSATEILAYGVKHMLKITIKRPRPYEELSNVHVHDLESADEYSFPSGHTTGAFALAAMLTLRYPKPAVYIPAFVWAGLVGYGRVYNGVHYPSDVLGGMAVGAGSAALTFALRGTLIDAFDRVTGRETKEEASFIIVPVEGGARAFLAVSF